MLTDLRDNTKYRDWPNATRTLVRGCIIEPMKLAEKINKEDNKDREFVHTPSRCYCPSTTDVIHTDRIEYDGELYDVFGKPMPWRGFDNVGTYISFIMIFREG